MLLPSHLSPLCFVMLSVAKYLFVNMYADEQILRYAQDDKVF